MIPGKLYKCPKNYLLVYPSKEKAAAATERSDPTAAVPAAKMVALVHQRRATALAEAAFWSKRLNCKVRYSEPEEVFMYLEQKDKFIHVLFGEKQGWIINKSWLEIERIK